MQVSFQRSDKENSKGPFPDPYALLDNLLVERLHVPVFKWTIIKKNQIGPGMGLEAVSTQRNSS